MINDVSNAARATTFQLPEKPFVETASCSFFGTILQENTSQFATLPAAKALATILGGEVVDLKDGWGGGVQSSQYAIQLPGGGPLLNAGLVAQRCQLCGVEAGLSAVLQEVGALSGHPISISDAWNQILTKEASLATAVTPGTASAATAQIAAEPVTSATPVLQNSPVLTPAAETVDTGLAEAARQFESLLIGQLLKAAREENSGGWLGSDDGDGGFSAVELAETHLAQNLAASGGLGLADLVIKELGSNRATSSKNEPA